MKFTMERKGRVAGGLWLIVLGVALVSLMWVPQVALYGAYPLMIKGVLSGMVMVMLAHYRSVRNALVMVVVLAVCAWLMDVGEMENLVAYAVAGVVLVMVVKDGEGNVWGRIAVGCLMGGVVLVAGAAVLRVWYKESGVGKAIEYGVVREWSSVVAGLIGAYAGTCLAKIWNRHPSA